MKSKAMEVQPVTLAGQHVRLEPLTMDHLSALWDIGQDPDLWQWTPSISQNA